MPWTFSYLANGATVFNFLPSQRLRSRPLDPAGSTAPDVRLTGAQTKVRDALLAALLGASPCVVLTGAAGLGKTTVLAAMLSRLDEPERQVLRLDGGEGGIEDAFSALFASPGQRSHQRHQPKRRLVLVMDQVPAGPPANFTYLELLSRMPGKAAPVQWVFVGRSQPWNWPGGTAAAWLREADPTCLALPALSLEDAWDLFHHRVNPVPGLRSAAKLVTTLLERSEGLPGRFDAAVRAAIAAGLLQGNPAQAA